MRHYTSMGVKTMVLLSVQLIILGTCQAFQESAASKLEALDQYQGGALNPL